MGIKDKEEGHFINISYVLSNTIFIKIKILKHEQFYDYFEQD